MFTLPLNQVAGH